MNVKDDTPPPGKFEGNASLAISEALYERVQDGFVDEQFGSVSENGLWEGLILVDMQRHDILGHHLIPAYIVTEDEQGFFDYEEFEDEDKALERYVRDLTLYERAEVNIDL